MERYVAVLPQDAVVIPGGAPVVDSIAEAVARAAGLETPIFHANSENLGRRAGPICSAQIIERTDRVVAFWDGRSRRTLNTLVLAERAGLPIEIFGLEGEAVDLAHALGVARERGVHNSIAAGEARATKTRHADKP